VQNNVLLAYCKLTDLKMIDRVSADGADDVFDLAIFQRQTIALLSDQTHNVLRLMTVFVAVLSLEP